MSTDLGQRIATRAYEHFLARGGEHGHHLEDWIAAETELMRTPYEVVLVDPGGDPIELIRAVRELTGMGLPEIRALIDAAPRTIQRARSLIDAERVRAALEPTGARVELRVIR